MKAANTGKKPSKATATLALVINDYDCPSDEKIEKIIDAIVKKYDLKNTKFTHKIQRMHGFRRTRFTIKAVSKPEGEPVVVALEVFSQLMGNIRVYERTIKYSCA